MPLLNDTIREYPRDTTIIRLIEEQTSRTPDARAAVCGSLTYSYAELQRDVNRLAHHLLNSGLGPHDYVGICVDRSMDMLVAVLATLKIGAVYVPLDPGFPRDRLEFMAGDCGLAAIVIHRQTEGVFDTLARRIHLTDERRQIEQASGDNLDTPTAAVDTAYILYTSGSTGKPKGVLIPHRALVNLLWSMREEPGMSASDVLLAVTTLSFDIAALELFLPLMVGACVVIASSAHTRDPRQLAALIDTAGATMLQATPIQWRMLVEMGWKGRPGFKILCGGEPLRPQLASALVKRGDLWNMYGPTETTVWSTLCRIDSGDELITVGTPIANTFLYVLDEHRQRVADGEKGELCIGGDGVAQGYLNRPELTADRFLQDPFRPEPDARMYRTGDLALIRDDGRTELFGRIDAQVKVRGFRIELGEIESVLARCAGVAESAVVVREEASGEQALAAYFVAAAGATNAAADARSFLREKLPDYMIPGHVIQLERMPQLPNGKIDRSALPRLSEESVATNAPERDGSDELESRLLAIWRSVLNLPHLTRQSNFFELGGRSLLAARLFVEIEKQLGKVLPLATLLQAPTVLELAAVIRDAGWSPPWGSLVPIRNEGSKTPIFFVHAIGGNIVNFHAFAARFESGQPIYGLQARGLDGKETPHGSIESMAADYVRSVRSVQSEGPYRLGGFSAGGVVAFEMARQLREEGEETSMLALLDTQISPPATEVGSRAGLPETLGRWRRTLVFNVRYAIRTGWNNFSGYKLRNWRMRLRIRAIRFGWGRLNAEESFLLALRRYEPKSYGGTAVLFRARNELVKYPDPFFGWKHFIRGGVQVVEIGGDHDSLLDEPYIGELAEELNLRLNGKEARMAGVHG